jgi:excisionase family DNA binding protein
MKGSYVIDAFFEIPEITRELQKGPEFYALSEAAKMLKVSYITLYRLVAGGEISASKVGGTWRITMTALDQYLQSRHTFNMEERI